MAAEVSRVLREMQLDTEGGLVPARGSVPLYSRRRSMHVKDDSAAVGATKADRKMAVARNKAVGSFTGVTKAELGGNKEAAGTGMMKAASWSDFGTCGTKPAAGNKTAPGSEPEPKEERKAEPTVAMIGVTKAELGVKEAAGSFTVDMGVKEAAGSFTVEMGVKEAAGSFTVDMGVKEAAGTGVVTEASWIDHVFLTKPPAGSVLKAELTGAMITKEVVPDSFMDRLKKRRPFKKLPPLNDFSGAYAKFPEAREAYVSNMTQWNYLVDLHEDVLRQHAKKGFAEVGVDFTSGVKKIFILPQQKGCVPSA